MRSRRTLTPGEGEIVMSYNNSEFVDLLDASGKPTGKKIRKKILPEDFGPEGRAWIEGGKIWLATLPERMARYEAAKAAGVPDAENTGLHLTDDLVAKYSQPAHPDQAAPLHPALA